MLQRIRPKLTYANVISTVCLFILLGGGAYAATVLPKNSVGTAQLKKNAVTGVKVKDGTLTGADINLATLGTVPAASSSGSADTAKTADRAGTAGSAETAKTAERATTADSATSAGTAGHADTAGTASAAAHADTAGTATHADSAGTADSATHANTAGSADTATHADTAASADTATHADSADSATTATNAGNALTLGGKTAAELKVHCPVGMNPAAGVCIDAQPSANAPLRKVFERCAAQDRRLPTQGELIAYVALYGSLPAPEWIEPQVVYESQFQGVTLEATKFDFEDEWEIEYGLTIWSVDVSRPYRCATTAAN